MNFVVACIYFVNDALKEALDDGKHKWISPEILWNRKVKREWEVENLFS
jgi:hypothetical protein